MKFIRLTSHMGTDVAVNMEFITSMYRGVDNNITYLESQVEGCVITVKEDISTILRMIGE